METNTEENVQLMEQKAGNNFSDLKPSANSDENMKTMTFGNGKAYELGVDDDEDVKVEVEKRTLYYRVSETPPFYLSFMFALQVSMAYEQILVEICYFPYSV